MLRTAAANILRPHFADLNGDNVREALTFLVEPSRINSWVRSDDYTNAAWSNNGLSGVTGAATTAPDGTLTGCHLTENSISTSHIIWQPLTGATDSTLQANSFFVKAAERTWCLLRTLDKNNVAKFSSFNLASGVWGTIDATHTVVARAWGNGWWRLTVAWNVNTGATTPVASIGAQIVNNTAVYLGDGASGIYVWRGGWEKDLAFASSPIKTVAAIVTRAADTLTASLGFGVQDVTLYAQVVRPLYADASFDLGVAPGIVAVSSANPRLGLYFTKATRTLTALIRTASGDITATQAVPAGNPIRMSAQFKNLATGGQVALDVGAGLSAFSGAAVAFSAWGNQTLQLGLVDSHLCGEVVEILIARGLQTFTDMEAVL
jgi:hypothetical protein